jgi:hypothetical protein
MSETAPLYTTPFTAGPAMDRRIHREVMGQCVHRLVIDALQPINQPEGSYTFHCRTCQKAGFAASGSEPWHMRPPWYSTDLRAAWLILNHLITLGYRYTIHGNFVGDHRQVVGIDNTPAPQPRLRFRSERCTSLPLAICQAALTAVQARRVDV